VINFRYHVVSLTAVFLALAIGLVVGTAALNGPLSEDLKNKVNALSQQNQQYRAQVNQLIDQSNRNEQFAAQAAPIILAGKLTGRAVLVVSTEKQKTGPYVDGLAQALALAGARVTGQIVIDNKFTDPANNESLLDLANSSAPPGVADLPLNSNGAETASAVLAAVLVNRNPPVGADTTRTVLTAFTKAGFIAPTGTVSGGADAIVFVADQPYTDREADGKNAAVLTIADQFDKAGPVVVATNGVAGNGNVVAALRGDPTLSKSISTVDNVATEEGWVATALALAEQVVSNKAGHYGTTSGASALLPKPQT